MKKNEKKKIVNLIIIKYVFSIWNHKADLNNKKKKKHRKVLSEINNESKEEWLSIKERY